MALHLVAQPDLSAFPPERMPWSDMHDRVAQLPYLLLPLGGGKTNHRSCLRRNHEVSCAFLHILGRPWVGQLCYPNLFILLYAF
jgi:hypothetical protein